MPRAAPPLARDCNSIVATILSSDARERRRGARHDRPLSLFRNGSVLYGVPGEGLGHTTRGKVIIGDFSGPIADLASCRAVVINGGFSLIPEAVFLHKPECTIPISAQFEQWLNAAEVEKMGYGRHFAAITYGRFFTAWLVSKPRWPATGSRATKCYSQSSTLR